MTPTSPLGGVLTGLLDGFVVVLAVLIVAMVLKRRRRPAAGLPPQNGVPDQHDAGSTAGDVAAALPEPATGIAQAA